jgi:rSAM/selenodomain-associated transferase 1
MGARARAFPPPEPGAEAVVVFARPPRAGHVKTRLARDVGASAAAELYRCFLADVLDRVSVARCVGAERADLWTAWAPGPADDPARPPPQIASVIGGRPAFPQQGHDLGARLSHAIELLLAQGYRSVAVIGSDSPSLPVSAVYQGVTSVKQGQVVLAPAADGGFWLIALAEPAGELLAEVAWGTDRAFADVCARARALGIEVCLGPQWYDVDVHHDLCRLAADLRRAPGLCPLTRAALVRLGLLEAPRE